VRFASVYRSFQDLAEFQAEIARMQESTTTSSAPSAETAAEG
jgi:transcriptional regulator NrdR family protein